MVSLNRLSSHFFTDHNTNSGLAIDIVNIVYAKKSARIVSTAPVDKLKIFIACNSLLFFKHFLLDSNERDPWAVVSLGRFARSL